MLVMGLFGFLQGAWAQTPTQKNAGPIFEALQNDSSLVMNQYGMNLSPLLLQLIPLNRGSRLTGPYGFSYSSINQKNKVFRLGLGAFIDEDFDNSHINLRIGFGKLRKLSERLHLTTGWDFIVFAGSLNIPNENENFEDAGIGIGPMMGLQYYLLPNISLGTESFFFMGTTDSSPVAFRVIPPLAVFVHVNFTRTSAKSIRLQRKNQLIKNREENREKKLRNKEMKINSN